jgi:Ca2+-binding EF-hand superfamily protein
MMNIKRLVLLSFAATALATAALADGGPNGGPGGFLKSADLNKDGVIDQTEFQTARDKWFADLDANKDGFVSADELKAFGDKMHAQWAQKHGDQAKAGEQDQNRKHGDFAQNILQRVDTDKDGKISKAEFDAEGTKLFTRLDANGDGKIADNEMPQRHWARFRGAMFDRMDADHDGKVTKAEFQAAGEQMFQRLDKNGDGILEQDEMQGPHGGPNGDNGDMPPPPPPAGQAPTP